MAGSAASRLAGAAASERADAGAGPAAGTRPARFGLSRVVARRAELEAIAELIDAIPSGFVCLTLAGEPGIGKTTLWQEAVWQAGERGLTVLSCRPARSESKLSFAALGDLLAPLPDEALRALPAPQRRGLEVALLRADAGPSSDRRAVAAALLSVLRALARSAPVLLAVDDAQWLDAPTASALEFAVRRLDLEPVGLLTAVRIAESPAPTFERVVGDERRRRVELGPLSLAALHEIVSERLGRSFPRPTLLRIAQISGGNPFYALELARELARVGEPRAGAPFPVPADLRSLAVARIRRLPPATREALLAVAALSHPTTRLVGEDALGPAAEEGIIAVGPEGRVSFRHPLLASAVYDSVSPVRRRSTHRRLAQLVGDPEERARHLSLAADGPDEKIAQALERGATRARCRGAWVSAADLLELARALTPASRPADAQRRGIEAAEHYAHAGDRRRGRELISEILAAELSGALRAEALRVLAEISYHDEDVAAACGLFEEALAHVDDRELEIRIECGLSHSYAAWVDFEGAAPHAHRALELAEAAGSGALLAEGLACCAMCDFLCGRGVDWEKVERSLALEDPHRVLPLQWRPSVIAALLVLYAGRLSEARGRLTAVGKAALASGDESDLAFVLVWLSWLEMHAGDFRTAADHAGQAATLAAMTGSASMHAWALAQRAYVHAHCGEIAETRSLCAEALALPCPSPVLTGLWVSSSLALLELSVGDAAAAFEACRPLTEAIERQGLGEPFPAFFLPDALEALVALGELDRAAALVNALERQGEKLDRAWALATGARCRGLLLSARGELEAAERALRRALAEHDRLETPLERARTLLCLGRLERRRKRRKTARQALGAALALLEEIGASLWADRARAELERTHLREAPRELSPTERQVAELAAGGLTNRRIAQRLHLSEKTVEANLARAYRKLGIRSRAELGAAMAGDETARRS
jgi:DNA-binding CsgD family transcriptional regulator